MNHPLHSPYQQQSSPSPSSPPSSRHTAQPHRSYPREDWHQYTLTGSPAAARAPPNDIHFHHRLRPNRDLPLPGPQAGPQQYESLTGLLLQSGSTPTFGVGADDESYKHMSMGDDGSVTLDDGGVPRRRSGRCQICCFSCRYDSPCAILSGLLGLGALGLLLGVIFPSSSSSDGSASSESSGSTDYVNWDVISNILGYTYFLAWTLSFYPQIITNWRHSSKARSGVSLDFVVWNIVGFACYAIYTTSFRYSDVVRREYADRFGANHAGVDSLDNLQNVTNDFVNAIRLAKKHHHHDNSTMDDSSSTFGDNGSNATNGDDASDSDAAAAVAPLVKVNDVAFAWHALLLTIITFIQIACSGRGKHKEHAIQSAASDELIGFEGEEDEIIFENSITSGEEGSFLGGNLRSIDIEGEEEEEEDDDERNSIVGEADIQLEQQRRWERDRHWTRRISSATKCLVLILLLICVVGAVIVAGNVNIGYGREGGEGWQWIDYLYFLSFVKVGVSIVKYIPQVVLNFRRKSTSGWQIWNILLDFSGGTLSIVQLVGDSAAEARRSGLSRAWTGVAGNPAKLGLGLVSIFFDVVFLFQHYVLYRRSSPRRRPRDERDMNLNGAYETPLLSDQ